MYCRKIVLLCLVALGATAVLCVKCSDGICSSHEDWHLLVTEIARVFQKLAKDYFPETILELQEQLPLTEKNILKISVIGPINSGKTTSFTVLLGSELLPQSGEENTCVLVQVQKDSTIVEPILISPAGNHFTGEDIHKVLVSANILCQKAQHRTSLDTYSLKVRSFPGLEMTTSGSEISDQVVFVDYGGMNGADLEFHKEIRRKFFEETNVVLLMLKETHIRAQQVRIVLNDMKFLKHRPDILKENIFVVINFLETCAKRDSREYKTLLRDGQIKSLSKEDCISYLKNSFMEQAEIYAMEHEEYKGIFDLERIIVIGLADALDSMDASNSKAEQVLYRERSNWDSFVNTFSNHLQDTQVLNRKTKESYISTFAVRLETKMHEVKTKLEESQQKLEQTKNSIKQIETLQNEILGTICPCAISNIPDSLDIDGGVQAQASAQLTRCVSSVQGSMMKIMEKWMKLQSLLSIFPSITLEDFRIDSTIPLFAANVTRYEKHYRDGSICGRHWHRGAKQCYRWHASYSNAESDKDMICSYLWEVININRNALDETDKKFKQLNLVEELVNIQRQQNELLVDFSLLTMAKENIELLLRSQ